MRKRLIATLALTLALAVWHTEVVASYCTQSVIFIDGRAMICTSCCFYGSCTTTCT